MASYKPVAALSRGLAVLRAVNELRPATVGSIHAATGLDKATIVRMLETLQHEHLVMRGAQRNVYVPTGRTRELASGFDACRRLGEIASPVLGELSARFGWPALVAIADGDAMLLVESSANRGPLVLLRQPGYRAPMLVTAAGRAYLAFCSAAERDRVLASLASRKDDRGSVAPASADLHALLDEVRAAGFAMTDDDYSESEHEGALWAMAVPVAGPAGLYCTLDFVFVRSAVSVAVARGRFLAPMQVAAERLAKELEKAGMPVA